MDSLEFDESISKLDREKALESIESYYQTQLKTLERYGGINTFLSPPTNKFYFRIVLGISLFQF